MHFPNSELFVTIHTINDAVALQLDTHEEKRRCWYTLHVHIKKTFIVHTLIKSNAIAGKVSQWISRSAVPNVLHCCHCCCLGSSTSHSRKKTRHQTMRHMGVKSHRWMSWAWLLWIELSVAPCIVSLSAVAIGRVFTPQTHTIYAAIAADRSIDLEWQRNSPGS